MSRMGFSVQVQWEDVSGTNAGAVPGAFPGAFYGNARRRPGRLKSGPGRPVPPIPYHAAEEPLPDRARPAVRALTG